MSFHIGATRLGFACLVAIVAAGEVYSQAPAPSQSSLTLEDAFARALLDAPAMQAADQARFGAEAGVRQADRAVNPTVEFATENFGGWSAYQWAGRAETTLSFSQTLEMGGDREARVGLAQTDISAARADAGITRADLLFSVESAYITAQTTAADLVVALERLEVAKEIAATVERRVEAARDPLMASSRAQALLAEADIAVTSARLLDEAARGQLASYWGGSADFTVDLTGFSIVATAPKASRSFEESPEIARAKVEADRASATIAVERARAETDPTVSAGLRYFHEFDEAAFVVGVTIPLPLWDQNTGGIERAEAQRSQARYEIEALRRNVERQIASTTSQVGIARAEIEAIDARLLPTAQQALERARAGYAAGAFSYLDVLDAQRVLVDAQLRRNSALGSYHRARAALARLTGAYIGFEPTREISQ